MLNTMITLRSAQKQDARTLAELINHAGDGLPAYLWQKIAAPDQDIFEIGTARMLGKIGKEEIVVVETAGTVVAGLQGHAISENPDQLSDDVPAMFRPLCELEILAAGSWYVNMVAAKPGYRGKGIGKQLLQEAENFARQAGLASVSLIVADNNERAYSLYHRLGYDPIAKRPVEKENWQTSAEHWILMPKQL